MTATPDAARQLMRTGGRDDLQVDSSRCLRMRFSDSTCCRCSGICPQGAVSLDESLAINPQLCRACLLCTSVCPSGALEQQLSFTSCLDKLSRVSQATLGCVRTKERANAALTCLGGLSQEHLLTLCHTLSGELTLNLTVCLECPNSVMIDHVLQRLAMLNDAGLLRDGCRIVVAETATELRFHDESLGRRGFFTSLRRSLLQGAVEVLSENSDQVERHLAYGEKRLPARRELLNRTCDRLSPEIASSIREHFDCRISISDSCTACQSCVAICPTGALQHISPDSPPGIDLQKCTGCGLCVEFCLDQAVQIRGSSLSPDHVQTETACSTVDR